MLKFVLSFPALLALLATAQSPDQTSIKSGQTWTDTDNNRIYAGGANMFLENGVYYWVGEGKKVDGADISAAFNLYSSQDLGSWTFVGQALKNQDILVPKPYQPGPYRMERPKIFKCPSNGKYMMWFHCDTSNFAMRSVGVATSSSGTVEGPYVMSQECFKPDGDDSYDMGIFQDSTGTYLVRSTFNKYAGISALNDDCTNTTGIISSGPDIEGQAIMHDGNKYYLWGSHLTGWSPNPAIFSVSDGNTLNGTKWTSLGNPSGDATTFDSQSTFILPYTHADGHVTYMYMGDRWNANGPGGLDNATYIWLPLQQKGDGTWFLQWMDSWKLGDY